MLIAPGALSGLRVGLTGLFAARDSEQFHERDSAKN